MVINAAQLLKQLEPAVRPNAVPSSSCKPAGMIESQSFDQLLALAAKGGVHSGRQVTLGCDAQPPLEASQLERLAAAADQAEAAGSKRALMLIDGRAFVLDVANRTLTAELNDKSSLGVQHVDAAIYVANDTDSSAHGVRLPAAGLVPPSIAKQFDRAALGKVG